MLRGKSPLPAHGHGSVRGVVSQRTAPRGPIPAADLGRGRARIGRTGIVIGRKALPLAVDRNRVRRLLRVRLDAARAGDRALRPRAPAEKAHRAQRVCTDRGRSRAAPVRRCREWRVAMKTILLALIRGYQYALRPMLGANCRFSPSCSEYAGEASRSTARSRGRCLRAGGSCAVTRTIPADTTPFPDPLVFISRAASCRARPPRQSWIPNVSSCLSFFRSPR